jgi:hypothetical protein
VRWYKRQKSEDADQIRGQAVPYEPTREADSTATSEAMAEENSLLKKELHEARQEAEAWRSLVRNASAYCGEDLLKKFAPKPSRK